MDILFFGSGRFALKSLEALASAGHKITLVVTQPDKPKGRHLDFSPTEVKKRAQDLHLNVYQPQNPNTEEAIKVFKSIPADLFVVIAYGHILKNALLPIPKVYPLNIHASLLPKYRGAAPINWALLNGEEKTGISIIKMSEHMDAGDILLQREISIDRADDAETLGEKLAILAATALLEAIDLIIKGKAEFRKQNDLHASFAPKLEKRHGLIDWHKHAQEIFNQIRGLVPWPAAYTFYKGNRLKIWKAKIIKDETARPGEILKADNGLIVGTVKDALEIIELQLESGKRLNAREFLYGHRLQAGDRLG